MGYCEDMERLKMVELEKWERASNYCGEDLSDYYIVCGQHRDSPYSDQSNFIIATQRLGGESEETDKPKVLIAHFGNWLVGWNEMLLVHEDAGEDLINKAEQIVNDIESNIILDWDHYSEIKKEEVDSLVSEVKKDIENGHPEYWSCYDITPNMTDEEIWEIMDDHVN